MLAEAYAFPGVTCWVHVSVNQAVKMMADHEWTMQKKKSYMGYSKLSFGDQQIDS